MRILFSPHEDDETLWAATTILRQHPLVCVVTDSFIQPNRGDAGCSAAERRAESEAAAKILGAAVMFLGIPDNEITDDLFRQALEENFDPDVPVYLPALQGGNFAHDIVSRVGSEFFRDVTFYATYAAREHFTPIGEPVIPTEEEMALKNRALDCYVSQLNLGSTRPHFDAVRNKSEYLLRRL